MPIHDWTRLEPGDFHDFHQCWVVEIRNALNSGLLPPEYMAMAEQVTGRPIPDVVALHTARPRAMRVELRLLRPRRPPGSSPDSRRSIMPSGPIELSSAMAGGKS